MIEGYIGVPGAGKTLSQTMRAFKERRMYDEIVTNYGLNFPDDGKTPRIVPIESGLHFYELVAQFFADAKEGKRVRRLILLDEVHLIFDARMWSKTSGEFLRFLAQPRKVGTDMLYTAQHESQVEKRLRIVTNYLWLCRSWGRDFNFINGAPIWFWAKCYESFSFRKQGAKEYGLHAYRFKKKYGALYDTLEILDRMTADVGTQVDKTEGV